ncbi:MAG TPA: glycoside hydrolase family 88 protein [Clostridiales bacterium]|nr:MAG: Glycosyl Hydrolase Family 88 [Firmicutes bacterium ADurb.Bin262]HOU09744.1 glycoside hydrolase family 88 protein [Clostridiales bacterium]HQK72535.1 glycoside hydrolase family 88 protein [Clostridiales bacterium]
MAALIVVLALLMSCAAVIAAVDAVPLLRRWVLRIHIGQWAGDEEWKAAVEKALLNMAKNTPRVPASQHERLTFIERVKGIYYSDRLQLWQEAYTLAALNGLPPSGQRDGLIEKMISKRFDGGEWIAAPDSPECAAFAWAVLISPLYSEQLAGGAMRETAEYLKSAAGENGTVPYNKAAPAIRYVDTVGMVCPFLAEYAAAFGDSGALALCERQMREYCEYGLHNQFNIPVHCFGQNNLVPMGIYGWGRGCGWLAVGMMNTFKALLKSQSTPEIKQLQLYLLKKMVAYADSLLGYQTDQGSWCRQLSVWDFGETSATGMLAYYMKSMHRLTGMEKYGEAARRADVFLMKCTRKNGALDYAQGDTAGIGFYSVRLDAMPAAQAFCLMGLQ